MSELKQMYLNAYYGGTFTEPEMPGADTAKKPARSKAPADEKAAPAKRGRKAKADAAPAKETVTEAPKKRGRKAKAEEAAPAAKKRGRAKKQ